MTTFYRTLVNAQTVLSANIIDDTSEQVTIDSPYLTMEASEFEHLNKMQIGFHVMENIMNDDNIDGNRHTSLFKSVMLQVGVTPAACYTYAGNAKRHLRGGDAYETNRKWNAKHAEEKRIESEYVNPIEYAERWCVEDKETKKLLESFTSRSAAQQYNKTLKTEGKNTRWFDKTKEAGSVAAA